MSGHSKWSTIKRQKGAADIKRGQTFTKIANNITLTAKLGGSGDPESNPRLRMALEQARAANMPKDIILRAIDRGLGKLPGQTIEEVSFEGFGPGRVAYLIEGVTDNKLRTLQEIKNLFERSGGSLAGSGSVSYMFDKKGEIKVSSKGGDKDEEMLEIIDLEAEDVEDYLEEPFDSAQGQNTQKYLVYVESPELNTMSNNLTQAGFKVESAEIVFKPNVVTKVGDKEIVERIINFTQNLESHDDIHKVYANFDIPDNLID
ncbi:YebC/PmpR family DNA-binding transcriptional regulator [Candidatus Daviesbacteria bacterium]|nr:YebC/PmpR family DNA-binding transcriptional regulator [Candidatus Daviesbacteria bacterium]